MRESKNQLLFINYKGKTDKINAGDLILSATVSLPKATGRVINITNSIITIRWTNNEDIDTFSLSNFFSTTNIHMNRIRKTTTVIPDIHGKDTTAGLITLLNSRPILTA